MRVRVPDGAGQAGQVMKKKRTIHNDQFRAEAVAEALASTTPAAAKARGVSERTLRRWIAESKTDSNMAADVRRKSELIERDWAEDAKRAMRTMLEGLETLVARAVDETRTGGVPEGRIHEVAGALKIVGELGVVKEMFGGRHTADDRAPAAFGEDAGRGAAEGADVSLIN